MKIAISNIAWRPDEEQAAAELLRAKGITGVEVAPTKIGANPTLLSDTQLAAYRAFWNSQNIEIVAMQSLLFGRNELTIFESAEVRAATLAYLYQIIALGAKLGAKALVFGSPRNRKVGDLSAQAIDDIAIPFFKALATEAAKHGLRFCVEPNATVYGCDYITNLVELSELMEKVAHPGLGLHIDTASFVLAEDSFSLLETVAPHICHFHISEAYLNPVTYSGQATHSRFSQILKKANYNGYVSVEMRESVSAGSNLLAIAQALDFVKEVYG